jgi:acyl-coenzyme A thioesterase PaaI-like protein
MVEKIENENSYCFACGVENPIGLHLDFHFDGEYYIAEYETKREYQSYDGIVHGGIISTFLDEAMGGYLYEKGYTAVTARLNIRHREKTPTGVPLKIASWITSRRGSFVDMAATVSLPDGTVTAEGTAKMAIVEE